jgi:hypothetical protein
MRIIDYLTSRRHCRAAPRARDPAIHEAQRLIAGIMDRRVKPGDDGILLHADHR